MEVGLRRTAIALGFVGYRALEHAFHQHSLSSGGCARAAPVQCVCNAPEPEPVACYPPEYEEVNSRPVEEVVSTGQFPSLETLSGGSSPWVGAAASSATVFLIEFVRWCLRPDRDGRRARSPVRETSTPIRRRRALPAGGGVLE